MDIRFETFEVGVKHIRIWQQWRWATKPHYHECIELIHIVEGETDVEVGSSYHLKMGDTLFVPSYAVHSIPKIDYCTYIVLQISLALIPECQRLLDSKNPGVMVLRGDETGDLGRMFLTAQRMYSKKGIYKELYTSDEERRSQCRICAELIVGTVLRRCRMLGLMDTPAEAPPRISSSVTSAVDYIHAHYREKLRLSDIAEALYCSEQTLSAEFRSAMRMSVPQYITSLRTTLACRLLTKQPDIPLSEIAEQVGFQSMRSMLRAFRERYGCTPSEMKRGVGIADVKE